MWDDLLDDMTGIVVATFPVPLAYTRAGTTEPVTKTPSGQPLQAVYDVETVEGTDGGTRSVSNRRTVIDVRLADLGFTPAKSDMVTIPAGTFEVLNKDPSSSGMMKLHLRKVNNAESP